MTPRDHRTAERLGIAAGLLLGTLAALAVYQLADLIARQWNPFL